MPKGLIRSEADVLAVEWRRASAGGTVPSADRMALFRPAEPCKSQRLCALAVRYFLRSKKKTQQCQTVKLFLPHFAPLPGAGCEAQKLCLRTPRQAGLSFLRRRKRPSLFLVAVAAGGDGVPLRGAGKGRGRSAPSRSKSASTGAAGKTGKPCLQRADVQGRGDGLKRAGIP